MLPDVQGRGHWNERARPTPRDSGDSRPTWRWRPHPFHDTYSSPWAIERRRHSGAPPTGASTPVHRRGCGRDPFARWRQPAARAATARPAARRPRFARDAGRCLTPSLLGPRQEGPPRSGEWSRDNRIQPPRREGAIGTSTRQSGGQLGTVPPNSAHLWEGGAANSQSPARTNWPRVGALRIVKIAGRQRHTIRKTIGRAEASARLKLE